MIADGALLLALILMTGFVATRLARTFSLPHSVFLVLIGLICGGGLQYAGIVLPAAVNDSFADIILFILLPPLVFESAYNLDVDQLKHNIVSILALAIIGLIISTGLVGLGLHWAFGFELIPSLVFGALISATDPVAVVALFKEVGAPKRLLTLVEGESLFNDGTAIVLYRVLVAAAASPMLDSSILGAGALSFAIVSFGGIGVGIGLAVMTSGLLSFTRRSAAAQMGITVAASSIGFIVADHFLHVSGIFATLVIGVYLGHRARLEFNKEALHGMHSLWEFLSLCANSLVFLAVGFFVDFSILWKSLALVPATLVFVYGARCAAVPLVLWAAQKVRPSERTSFSFQTILMWGGLRGGLALALVMLLPETFPYKAEFLALTTAVVLSTLLLNALTITQVMAFFDLNRLQGIDQETYSHVLNMIHHPLFASLRRSAEGGVLSPLLVEQFEKKVLQTLDDTSKADTQQNFDYHQLLLFERQLYHQMLENREITKPAYRKLCQDVRRRLDSHKDIHNITIYKSSFLRPETRFVRLLAVTFPAWHRRIRFARLGMDLEILLFLIFGLESGLRHVAPASDVAHVGNKWLEKSRSQLRDLYLHYPMWANGIQNHFMIRVIAAGTHHQLEGLKEAEVISESIYSQAEEALQQAHQLWMRQAKQTFSLHLHHFLMGVRLFRERKQSELESLEQYVSQGYWPAGRTLHREDIHSAAAIVIAEGKVHLAGPFLNKDQTTLELGPRDTLLRIDSTHSSSEWLLIEKNGERYFRSTENMEIIVDFNTETVEVPLEKSQVDPSQLMPVA